MYLLKANYYFLQTDIMCHCQKVPKPYFESQISMSKTKEFVIVFFSVKNINLRGHLFKIQFVHFVLLNNVQYTHKKQHFPLIFNQKSF